MYKVSESSHLKIPLTNNVFLFSLVTKGPKVMKIVPIDSSYRDDSNSTNYKKLSGEIVII